VLCQCNPVGGSNQGLGRQDAGSWATGNSLGTDKFGNPGYSRIIGRAVIVEFAACLLFGRTGRRRFVTPVGSLVCDFCRELLNQKLANFGENSSVRILHVDGHRQVWNRNTARRPD